MTANLTEHGSMELQTFVVVLHVVFAIVLVGLVLVQRSEGGGLGLGGGGGGGGGMGGFMSARGTANLLTRATAITATLFFVSSLGLSIMVSQRGEPTSIVDSIPQESGSALPAADTAPAEPSVPAAE